MFSPLASKQSKIQTESKKEDVKKGSLKSIRIIISNSSEAQWLPVHPWVPFNSSLGYFKYSRNTPTNASLFFLS
jgi:hypothetical protein